ncbi:hypothetical protein ACFQ0T_15800 [Kitasatospora gansuensis]
MSYEPAEPFPGTRPAGSRPPAADPFAADPFGTAGPEPTPEARSEAEAEQPKPAAKAPAAAPARRGKGRKLVTYAVVLVLFAYSAAYGTGLMLNQADIPKGTTVLGTDIGGDTRDQAVNVLDGTVAKTGQQPLKLKLGEQTVDLDPTAAGLGFDTTATVDGLTKHSYNPVEVIGSLAAAARRWPPRCGSTGPS